LQNAFSILLHLLLAKYFLFYRQQCIINLLRSFVDTNNSDLLRPCGSTTSTKGCCSGLQSLLAGRQSRHLLQRTVTMLQSSKHCRIKQFLHFSFHSHI